MNYIGDKHYWNEKFENRSDKPLRPEKSIIENIEYFKKGTVLDIACGDGRNTLFLLEKGFKVTGIDFSYKALKRLEKFAKLINCTVNTKQIDLCEKNALKDIGTFDNIVINHYRINKEQLKEIENIIADDGILFICGFGHKHKVDAKIRKEDLIQPTDFNELDKSLELIKYDENEDERGFCICQLKIPLFFN